MDLHWLLRKLIPTPSRLPSWDLGRLIMANDVLRIILTDQKEGDSCRKDLLRDIMNLTVSLENLNEATNLLCPGLGRPHLGLLQAIPEIVQLLIWIKRVEGIVRYLQILSGQAF